MNGVFSYKINEEMRQLPSTRRFDLNWRDIHTDPEAMRSSIIYQLQARFVTNEVLKRQCSDAYEKKSNRNQAADDTEDAWTDEETDEDLDTPDYRTSHYWLHEKADRDRFKAACQDDGIPEYPLDPRVASKLIEMLNAGELTPRGKIRAYLKKAKDGNFQLSSNTTKRKDFHSGLCRSIKSK